MSMSRGDQYDAVITIFDYTSSNMGLFGRSYSNIRSELANCVAEKDPLYKAKKVFEKHHNALVLSVETLNKNGNRTHVIEQLTLACGYYKTILDLIYKYTETVK